MSERPFDSRQLRALDSARRQARGQLAQRVATARVNLSPHSLMTLWKAQQLRRVNAARADAGAFIHQHRTAITAGSALLAAATLLAGWFGWFSRRNDWASTAIDDTDFTESRDMKEDRS